MRAALLLLVLVACGGERATVLRLGHGLDASHPVHLALLHFAERVADLSRGELSVEVYPAEQLGSERELVELLQIGSVAMTKVSASVLGGFSPDFHVFGLPYLFRDDQHLEAVLDGRVGRDLLHAAERFRLLGLTYYDAGRRSFYTRTAPIRSPDDLRGLKIRTQESAMAMELVSALGASPTPLAWGELYSALQQGVVDGAENNAPSFYLSGHYEVCRFYSLDEHTAVPDVLLISTVVWSRLDAKHRSMIEEAAAESAKLQRRLWKEATEEALIAIRASGVNVLQLDKARFREEVEPLIDEYRKDPILGGWIERIEASSR